MAEISTASISPLLKDEPCWSWLTAWNTMVSSLGVSPHQLGLRSSVAMPAVESIERTLNGPADGIACVVYPVLKAVGSLPMLAFSGPPSSDCQSAKTDENVIFTSNSFSPCSTEETWSHPVVETGTYSGFVPLFAAHVAW